MATSMYGVGPSYAASAKDRTSEFHSMLAKYAALTPPAPSNVKRPTSAHTQFSQRAQAVASELSATTAKLERLSQLARRRSLFDDRPVEISELTYIIKHDIAGLNRQLAELQQLSAHNQRSKGNRAEEHRSNVVTMLQSTLANTTTSFQEILEVRTQNMKASKDRSDQFFNSAAPSLDTQRSKSPLYSLARSQPASAQPSPPPSTQLTPASALQKRHTAAHHTMHDEEASSSEKGFLSLNMMESGSLQQQQFLLQDMEEQQAGYMQQRSNAIESIESTISELGQIFGQLAHMVAQQGETVQRIDDDVLHVSDNVEGARRELLKYYANISNNRWLMLKIFGVLIVFFLRMYMLRLTLQSSSLSPNEFVVTLADRRLHHVYPATWRPSL